MARRVTGHSRTFIITSSVLVLLTSSIVYGQNTIDASDYADHWFALVDQQEFEQAWGELATNTKQELDKNHWLFGVRYVHERIGSIRTRNLTENNFEYGELGDIQSVTFSYRSDYTGLPEATETLRLGRENGLWVMLSYELQDPASNKTVEPYASNEECINSFSLEGHRSSVDVSSGPGFVLSEFLEGVATGNVDQVVRYSLVFHDESLDGWRKPQCYLLSRSIDVGNLYPDNFCFQPGEILIEVLEKHPDDSSYYSLEVIEGRWKVTGFRSKESYESCMSRGQ